MYSIRLSETSDGRYSATLSSGEILVSNSRSPAADACKVLVARGITGQIQVSGDVGTPFVCDVERTAAWAPRSGASRLIARWPHLAHIALSRDE